MSRQTDGLRNKWTNVWIEKWTKKQRKNYQQKMYSCICIWFSAVTDVKLKMTFKKQQHPNITQLGFVAMVTNTGLHCTLMKHLLWIEGETVADIAMKYPCRDHNKAPDETLLNGRAQWKLQFVCVCRCVCVCACIFVWKQVAFLLYTHTHTHTRIQQAQSADLSCLSFSVWQSSV